ncbi:conserved hypothetical protein [Magnetospirillum sp. LM-5]|uniref:BrnA antitoxin family protein n=1 Tax=Magnetospirillum sp. LM-5 TaxID=2681466 RepID=UPI00137FAAD8|nr:BrnA antitoxin family protein [Magnetospirillum sp. LM-5]CAA7618963.1 conserved hypothetical protein [Magnetospirillum sp. LM-5]
MQPKKPSGESTWVDPDDAPELTEEWFASADLYQGEKLVRKGGRPKSPNPKQMVSLRLDPGVLEYFRATGPGWQSRIDAALREYVQSHRPHQ